MNIPCDICDAEVPTEWVGPDDLHGLFLCENCRNFSPKEQFNIALTIEKEKVQ